MRLVLLALIPALYFNIMYAYAQGIESYIQLMNSLLIIIPTIFSIIVAVVMEIRKRQGDNTMLDNLISISKMVINNSKATDKWILENMSLIRDLSSSIISSIAVISPEKKSEIEKILSKYSVEAERINEKIIRENKELDKLYETLQEIINNINEKKSEINKIDYR